MVPELTTTRVLNCQPDLQVSATPQRERVAHGMNHEAVPECFLNFSSALDSGGLGAVYPKPTK